MSRFSVPEVSLAPEQLTKMESAALEIVECMRALVEGGRTVVTELIGTGEFMQWEHYPPDDARDPETHAQYYFHAHSPEDRTSPECGHFHTFLRREGMPEGIDPEPSQSGLGEPGKLDPLTHVIGISMSREGLPIELFTTNRWVSNETWYAGGDVASMLDRFRFAGEGPTGTIDRWISALMILFRPQIEDLLAERDRRIAEWQQAHPDSDAFEDHALEILSARPISIEAQIRWLSDRLE